MQFTSPNSLDGGLDLASKEWKIGANKTSKTINMWFQNGELGKRYGQSFVEDTEIVESPAFASYKNLYKGFIIKHCGTKMYKQDPTTGAITTIYSGLTAIKGSFFKFNSNLYYIQSGKFLIWDGATAVAVTPYIPLVIINRTPSGGGNVNEQYNRIGAGFINAFNGTGANVAYTLTDKNLDATPIVASYDSGVTWDKIEGVDFTVNRTTGVITWTVLQPIGTNNIRVKAYKTDQAAIDSILNCFYAIPFGGQNDNRMFIGGNGTGYYYYTGISSAGVDATYWAYNNYNIIGNSDEDIKGFGKFYDVLTIHKVSGEIFGVTYTWDGTKGIFNSFQINDQYGCDCPGTMQSINNQLVWLTTKYGVCILVGTTVGGQRNAFPISRNINPRLMKDNNLISASSVSHNGRYWLCVNDKVYLWDFTITPYVDTGNPDKSAELLSWWYFDNINAHSFITDAQELYYINRTSGKTVKIRKDKFSDFGLAIKSLYKLPSMDLGGGVYEFDVMTMWVDIRSDTRTQINIKYITSDGIDVETEPGIIDVGSFSIPGFSIPNFTLNVSGVKQTFVFQPAETKIDLYGVEFSNEEIDRDMNISNIVLSYKTGKSKR
jgi:hypothetical protein